MFSNKNILVVAQPQDRKVEEQAYMYYLHLP